MGQKAAVGYAPLSCCPQDRRRSVARCACGPHLLEPRAHAGERLLVAEHLKPRVALDRSVQQRQQGRIGHARRGGAALSQHLLLF